MASLAEFFETPTAGYINGFKKDQLVEIADHYCIVVAGINLKEEIRKAILLSLFERGEKLWQVEKLELEKMRQNTEQMKLELEQSKLQLNGEGKLFPHGSG